jgi:hypothetical protein
MQLRKGHCFNEKGTDARLATNGSDDKREIKDGG